MSDWAEFEELYIHKSLLEFLPLGFPLFFNNGLCLQVVKALPGIYELKVYSLDNFYNQKKKNYPNQTTWPSQILVKFFFILHRKSISTGWYKLLRHKDIPYLRNLVFQLIPSHGKSFTVTRFISRESEKTVKCSVHLAY